jgi:hypothetical protein
MRTGDQKHSWQNEYDLTLSLHVQPKGCHFGRKKKFYYEPNHNEDNKRR